MAASTTTGQTIDVVTPAAGESVTEGEIVEWHFRVGDAIKRDDVIVEIATDKINVDLPSPATGTVTELLAEEGDTVTVGQVIARIAVGAMARPPPRLLRRRPRASRPPGRRPRAAGSSPPGSRPRATVSRPTDRQPRVTAPRPTDGRPRPRRPTACGSHPWRRAQPPPRAWTSRASPAAAPPGASSRPTCLEPWPATATRRRPRAQAPPRRPRAPSRCGVLPRRSPATWSSRSRSPPPRASAHSPSPPWTPAGASSRRRGARCRSPTSSPLRSRVPRPTSR